jgi:hypothetical protein
MFFQTPTELGSQNHGVMDHGVPCLSELQYLFGHHRFHLSWTLCCLASHRLVSLDQDGWSFCSIMPPCFSGTMHMTSDPPIHIASSVHPDRAALFSGTQFGHKGWMGQNTKRILLDFDVIYVYKFYIFFCFLLASDKVKSID